MPKRSFKVYLVVERGYEYDSPIRAYTKKSDAQRCAARHDKEAQGIGYLNTEVMQIDLVVQDGALELMSAIRPN